MTTESSRKRNYQKELDHILDQLPKDPAPRLFLHSCCAPCSSYVLEYLSGWFEITDYFYNPNISPAEENEKRSAELSRLISQMPFRHPVHFVDGPYEPELFREMARGLEDLPEGDLRCRKCYELRMRKAAQLASEGGFDYFTTTLSISPLKNARWINEIGESLAQEYHIAHLPSDFKKRNGYLRSIQLSGEYGLYRQNYCGCAFSKRDAQKRDQAGKEQPFR